MSFILGMDTGGTYTDGIILETEGRRMLCKAKALTTKEDLTIGIKNCLEQLSFTKFQEISLVSLSTTLATNALVEGKGGKVGLIYMGAELEDTVPAAKIAKVTGGCDIKGEIIEQIQEKQIRTILEGFRGAVSVVAISGYASVRNPKQEREIKALVQEVLGLPVVCGHELTSALGFHQRTVTAVLNAKLIPIIEALIKTTKQVMGEKAIDAPLMMVKGDGTLMTEEMVLKKPIETILSGPAASVIGAGALTGLKDAIVLDMGGTTTDVANIEKGVVKIKKEGAKVGGWHTRVLAAEISTFGLGGDSRICLDKKGNICIGPNKVWPLCVMGSRHPGLIHELKSFQRTGEFKTYSEQEADCFLYAKCSDTQMKQLAPWQQKILMKLQEAPHSLTYLANFIGEDPENMNLEELLQEGIIERIAVTPTDILHVKGIYNQWDRDIAQGGASILARRLDLPLHDFLNRVMEKMVGELALTCIQSAVDFSEQNFEIKNSKEAMFFIRNALGSKNNLFSAKLFLKKPIVAIGAPAAAWADLAGEHLNTQVIVPQDADVANAYGAATGQITEKVDILVSRDGNKYILNLPWDRMVYTTRDEAMFYAVHEGRKYIEQTLKKAGCIRVQIIEKIEDIMVEVSKEKPKSNRGAKVNIAGVGSLY